MFTGHFTAQSIDAWEQVAMEGFNLVEPFFRRKAFFIQRQNMDIAIADMGNSYAIQAVFFTEFRNLFGDIRNLIERHDKIFRLEHLIYVTGRFGKLFAQRPDTFIGFEFIDRTIVFSQITEQFHLAVRFFFIERFYRDDDVITAFIDVRHLHIEEFASHDQSFIIHEFDTGRIDTSFQNLIRQGKGFIIGLEYADHIEYIRSLGIEFYCNFRDNAQCTFGTGIELFQAETGRALFQAGTGFYDFPGRSYDFQAVYLMTGRAILYSLVAAGVIGYVAADLTAVGTGRVAGIQKAMTGSFTL